MRKTLAMEKKRLRAAIIISTLLFLAVAGTQFINLGKSNPFAWIPTPVHPQITIVSPEENSIYALNALTIAFNVSINFERGWSYLSYVSYKASWKQDEITVYDCETNGYLSELSYKLNLTGIHEGTHTVLISAVGHGGYANDGYGLLLFHDAYNSTSISFTIHSVSISSPQNKTYDTSDVLLFFEVHHSFKTIAYSLDGQDKVAVSGGTWLVDLPDGGHNVTVYVMDKAGNVLPSETIYFSVDTPESFPATMIMVPIGSIAFVGAGLMAYFKRKR